MILGKLCRRAADHADVIRLEVQQSVSTLTQKMLAVNMPTPQEEHQLRFSFWKAIEAYANMMLESHDLFVYQRELFRCMLTKYCHVRKCYYCTYKNT